MELRDTSKLNNHSRQFRDPSCYPGSCRISTFRESGFVTVDNFNPYSPPKGDDSVPLVHANRVPWRASRVVAVTFAALNLLFTLPTLIIWLLTFYYAIRPSAPEFLIYQAHMLLGNFIVVLLLGIYWAYMSWRNSLASPHGGGFKISTFTTVMLLLNGIGCFKFFVIGL